MTRYVPVLRTKMAEWTALRELADDVRQTITPCLEVLPHELARSGGGDNLPHAVRRFAQRIRRNWGPRPIFVDASHLTPTLRPEMVALLAEAAPVYGVTPIWTLSLYEDAALCFSARQAATNGTLQFALRADYGELDKDDTSDLINFVLRDLGVSPARTCFLVDCGVTDSTPPDYEWLADHVPHMATWKEFVVAAGSFLPDLDGLAVGTRFHPRWDWLHWEAWARVIRHTSTRLPTFSDYTIQHAIFREPVAGANPTASIRYAAGEYWVIVRGEALWNRRKKESRHNQYFGNARLLAERDEFKGAPYSFGDRYISDVAQGRNGPGTATTWLAAGTNHHMTLTARQIKEVAGTTS